MNALPCVSQKLIRFFAAKSLPVLLFAIFALSCSEDELTTGICLLMKSNTTYEGGATEETIYTYNSDDQLIRWEAVYTSASNEVYDPYIYEYTYNTDGYLDVVMRDEGRDGKEVYSYNSDHQVMKVEYYDATKMTVIIENEYNTSGQVIKRQHYSVSGSVATPDHYSMLEYASTTTQNVLRTKRYSQDGTLLVTTEYEYDNKKSPWSSMGLNGLYTSDENNYTKVTRTEGASVQVSSFSFEYTEKGYPHSMTYINNDGVASYTDVYTYDCK